MASDSIVELTVGDVVKATVKNIVKNYAIVSLGDIVAYLPSSEYSWGRDNNLKNKLKKKVYNRVCPICGKHFTTTNKRKIF